MKIKNLFYMLLALPLAFAACTETPDEVKKEAQLTLTSADTLEFNATGGTAEGLAESLQSLKIVVDGKEYGVKVKEFVFIVEIAELKGKERLEKIAPVRSITEI